MHIGMLTTSYPRHAEDVAGVFVRSMARALVARGHSFEVLAPMPEAGGAPPSEPGIDVRWVDYAPTALRRTFYGAGVPDNLRDPLAWPGLVGFPAALYRAASQRVGGWDAIISHWALPSALVAGRVREKRPHLAVLHSADVFLLSRMPFASRWIERVGASAGALLFASSSHRSTFLDALPALKRANLAGRCHASAMGIDDLPETRARRTLRKALGISGFTALSLGRLVPIKGLEHLIDAVDGLRDVDLIVAGDGPTRAELEARGRARFVGTVTGPDKAELLRAADVFVVPSLELPSGRTEGTPTAALEAALAGRPIIASETAGLAEVFEDGRSALLVRPGDPFALRRAIARTRDDPALRRRLGRAARTVGRRYLWTELAPHIEALLVH